MIEILDREKYPFELTALPYSYDALDPFIDPLTMQVHHTKHHTSYIEKLNAVIRENDDLKEKSLSELLSSPETLPESIRQNMINFGGGHANHLLFWEILTPKTGSSPTVELAKAINSAFGNFENFEEKFTKEALNRFGSGWVWLVIDENKHLQIYSTANQDSPLANKHIPILTLDVWEHAYYLNYQNRRDEYIEAWWNLVNWERIKEFYLEIVVNSTKVKPE